MPVRLCGPFAERSRRGAPFFGGLCPSDLALTNAGTASSAEEFVLMARWSSKVVVVGGATEGALDYSNVRSAPLPSGVRVAHIPMTRRGWLPETSVDAGGIAPDVRVPDGASDWAVFALGVLAARDAE
ncbi:hypothetical protein [Rubrivirga sp.]|uniref:hypothetical protein n=1 Tax=Rubrivirga sp. TaxID=1885344 RepID=UPI003B523C2D